MKNIIEINNLNLSFGEQQVLKNVSLAIPEKKIVALIGPSGCGKSTLLRCLNRMHDLNSKVRITGEIRLDGEDILHTKANVVEIRRNIGMVFQKPNPFPKSIFENIAYGLRINGTKDKNSKKRLKKASKTRLSGRKSRTIWRNRACGFPADNSRGFALPVPSPSNHRSF